MPKLVKFTFRWRGLSHSVPDLDVEATTVGDLKELIWGLTGISSDNQKLMGLVKSALFKLEDSQVLGSLELKLSADSCSFMITGTPDSEIQTAKDDSEGSSSSSPATEVVNDLSLEFGPSSSVWKKLSKHSAACEIHFITPARPGKKLLVLDLDHTVLDFSKNANGERDAPPHEMRRPFLFEFLASVYVEFDIAVWSQTSWRWLEIKLHELGLISHAGFNLCFALDKTTMFRAGEKNEYVKPLSLIYTKSPGGGINWGPSNVLHIDDLTRNFALNPKNGVTISPFRRGVTPSEDVELVLLAKYLLAIAPLSDLSSKPHSGWREESMSMLQKSQPATAPPTVFKSEGP